MSDATTAPEGDRSPDQPKRAWLPIVVGALFALLLLLPLCSFQVRQSEQAIVKTFGRAGAAPVGPGFYFKAPWPIQKVDTYQTSLQFFRTRFEQNYTRDSQSLVVSLFVAWRIDDPVVFQREVGNAGEAQRILSGLLSTVHGAVITRYELGDLIAVRPDRPDGGAGITDLGQFEQEIREGVQAEAQAKGIFVEMVGVEHLNLPQSISANVMARMNVERQTRAESIRLAGQEAANTIKTQADLESSKIRSEAQAEARKVRGEGDLVAAQAYEEFAKDPEFAILLRKLESLAELTRNKTTLIIDRKVLPFDLLEERAPE